MEKLIIVGAGGFGRTVLEFASRNYDCAFADDGMEAGTVVDGAAVLGSISGIQDYIENYKALVVAIGNNKLRETVYLKAKEIGFKFPNIVCNNVYISPYAKVGAGCVFMNNVCIQNNATIGDGVILNPGVEAHNGSQIGNYSLIYTNSVVRTYATLGNRVWVGSNVTISNEISIPDDYKIEDGQSITRQELVHSRG